MSLLNEELWCQLESHFQKGQYQQAADVLQMTLSQAPADPEALFLFELARSRLGQPQTPAHISQTVKQHSSATSYPFDPTFILSAISKLANPIPVYRAFAQQAADDVEGFNNLAIALARQGQTDAAVTLLTESLAIDATNPKTHNNLGRLLRLQNRFDEALEQTEKALLLDDRYAEAYLNRGSILRSLGQLEPSIQAIRTALAINPDYIEALDCLAYLLKETGQTDESQRQYQRLYQLNPNSLNAALNLGILYGQANQLDQAEQYYRQAIKINPQHADARNNFGNILKNQLCFNEAIEQYQMALKIRPGFAEALSNYLFLLSYNVLCDPETMLAEHRKWDQTHGAAGQQAAFRHHLGADHSDNKKLRVGYVSPDFRTHSVSYFFEPIASGYNRQTMEVYCYAEVARPDRVTERLQSLVDGWYSTVGKTDEQIARQIHADGIDVLVDLTGHTANNRLKVFTYKPAPLQVTYMGYFTTTGLSSIDYWITDNTLHPPDTIELSVEQMYHLPRCLVAYTPYHEAPEVIQRQGQDIVFGCFNEISKISPQSIKVWSEILHTVPSSRLLIKARQLSDDKARERLIARFTACGIAADRLILRSLTASLQEHLAVYGEVDITLDTMPRTGFTTTTEALWMGVPVITLPGERFIERVSASMLEAIGMEDWIATSEQDYIARAVALAQDEATRIALRKTQRTRMAASPLCDGTDMAQQLELAYRELMRHKYPTAV